jgi:hypothetical protein|tara:strand:- start:326 stop:502 length:177 start_codon:yes stop_codon:yes gene_type:complete
MRGMSFLLEAYFVAKLLLLGLVRKLSELPQFIMTDTDTTVAMSGITNQYTNASLSIYF